MYRTLLRVLVYTLFLATTALPVAAQTNYSVLYRPLPYPKLMHNGNPMPHDKIEIVHVWDGYLTTQVGASTKLIDDVLQVGGNGYTNRTYLRFDTTGLPKQVTSVGLLFMQTIGLGKPTTPVKFYRITGDWLPAGLRRYLQPPVTLLGTVQGPYVDANSWVVGGFAAEYRKWQDGTSKGLRLDPQYTNNRWDTFYSSRTPTYGTASLGPALSINFTAPAGMPRFKMPLPGGHSWLVTTEIGGYDCRGGDESTYWPDTTHQGNNYFTLDFSSRTEGGSFTGPVPILAVADGVVHAVGGCKDCGTGFIVTLKHGDYYTRYLHLAEAAAQASGARLKNGQALRQGDQIGIMGNTGISTGTHLHINFWYGGLFQGKSSNDNLSYVVMDSRLLKSYQTACSVHSDGRANDYKAYYYSSNTPTGK